MNAQATGSPMSAEDKSVKVEFNFSDQYLLVMDFVQQNTVEPLKLTLEKRN